MRLTLSYCEARIMAALTSAFLAVDSAWAHGGISALGGLRDGLLGLTGIAGLPVLGVMLWILLRRRRQEKADITAGVGIAITMAYVIVAMFFYFAGMDSTYAKFPGAVAAINGALLSGYFLRRYKIVLAAVLGFLSTPFLAMLVIPAHFWKGNAFDWVETVFVDNSAELDFVALVEPPDSARQLLKLSDGRLILLFERDEAGMPGDLYTGDPMDLVAIQGRDYGRGGRWYQVTQYRMNSEYRRARDFSRPSPRHSLFQRTVKMYEDSGRRAAGVLLTDEADIDFDAIIINVLPWAGTSTLKSELVRLGNIDVNRQGFVDAAFRYRYIDVYRFLARTDMDVNAVSSDGQSFLHRAADVGDVRLMQELVGRGADLAAMDSQGRTPAQLFRDRHGRMPAMMETFNRAFPEIVRQ